MDHWLDQCGGLGEQTIHLQKDRTDDLQVALVATNSLLSSQLIVGIISVLHEVANRFVSSNYHRVLIPHAELRTATVAPVPHLHWVDIRLVHH